MSIERVIAGAMQVLVSGGVVVFPTDTVWGIGVHVENEAAIEKLYRIKKRDVIKPTAVLVGSFEQARTLGRFSRKAKELAERYWPGALTLVVGATPVVPRAILGEDKTVGLRVPNFQLVQDMCLALGSGIVTASANFAGKNAPKTRADLDPVLVKLANFVFEGVEAGGQQASTVVDVTGEGLTVLREGPVKL